MEDHKKKCCYAVALGTNIHSIDEDEFTSLTADTSFLYRNSGVESVQIGMVNVVMYALHNYIRDHLLREIRCKCCEEACERDTQCSTQVT